MPEEAGEHAITCLFVYGTLSDPAKRQEVMGRPCRVTPALLRGYERREGRYAYLVRKEGAEVHGWALADLGARDFTKLDAYEAVEPRLIAGARRRLYTRERAEVVTPDGQKLASWV